MKIALLVGMVLAACACARGPAASDAGVSDAGAVPTFYRDVLPIVRARCARCHVTGGIGPFPLGDYDSAQAVRGEIGAAVRSGRMPPWLPSQECSPLASSRRLDAGEVEVLARWAESGAPAGDPADTPPPGPPPPEESALPWVDATLAPEAAYVPARIFIDERCFTLDPRLPAERALVGLMVRPVVATQVHGVRLFVARREDAARRDAADPAPGWSCEGGPGIEGPLLAAWVGGAPPVRFPEGTGVFLGPDTVLAMQVSYHGQHGPEWPDRTHVEVQYARGEVARAQLVTVETRSFTIPPRIDDHKVDAALTFSADATIHGLTPQMRWLGVRLETRTSGGDCLLAISDWDTDFRESYLLGGPVSVRRGDTVNLRCGFQNSSVTPVAAGDGPAGETCAVTLVVVPR